MKKIKFSSRLCFLSFFLSLAPIANTFGVTIIDKAIFGEDNRSNIYSTPPFIQHLSESIAGHFSKDILINKGGSFAVQSIALGRRHCSNIPFAEEIVGPRCTGFLVAPNIIATAGHCMKLASECSDFYWAFGYKLKSKGDNSYLQIPASNVYSCKKVLAQKAEYLDGTDFALIQLDRDVVGRGPVTLDFESDTPVGTSLFVIGHPSSLPLKYTDSGIVSKSLEKAYFSELDIFGGNSGSPVFDESSGKVTGITSSGNSDWVWNSSQTCKVIKQCAHNGTCVLSASSKIKLMKNDFEMAFKKARE